MKNINKLTLAALSLFSFSVAHAQSSISEDFKTSAKIENFCSISAQDVNFGVVALPLTAQTANSSMSVLCTNNTSYKIDLAYGGIYGSGTINGGINYSLTVAGHGSEGSTYNVAQDGQYIGRLICWDNDSISFSNLVVANVYGYSAITKTVDARDDCNSSVPRKTKFTTGEPYAYGVMKG